MSDKVYEAWENMCALRNEAGDKHINQCGKYLLTYPWIRSRVEAGSLDLVSCYYDLRSGELTALDEINASTLSASKI